MDNEDLTLEKLRLMAAYHCVRITPFMEFKNGTKGSVLLLRFDADDSLVVLVNSPERNDENKHGKDNGLYPSELDQFYAYRQFCIEKYDGHYCMSKERYEQFGFSVLTDEFLSAVIADFICANINNQRQDPRHITNWNTSRTSNKLSQSLHACTISEIEDELTEFQSDDNAWQRAILLETLELYKADQVLLKNLSLDWKTVRNKYAEWLWNDDFKLKLCFAERVFSASKQASDTDWRRLLEQTMRNRTEVLEDFRYSKYSVQEIIGLYALCKHYCKNKPDTIEIQYAHVGPEERIRIFQEYFYRFSDEMMEELKAEDDPLRTELPSLSEANERARQRIAQLRGKQPEGLSEEQQEVYAKYEQAFCVSQKVGQNVCKDDFVMEKNDTPTVINVQGDCIIGEKHVTLAEPKPKVPKPARKPKAQARPDRNYITFTMSGITEGHLQMLRQKLIQVGWIANDTQPDAFSKLFSGKTNTIKITWTGIVGKGMLRFLFTKMVEQRYIIVPDSHSIDTILENHFIDTDGNYLSGLNSSKESIKHLPVVKECLDILQLEVDTD